MSLRSAIDQIQTALVERVEGLSQRTAPVDIPGQAAGWPMVICYPETGNWGSGPAGAVTSLHNIVIELHVQEAKSLEAAFREALRYSYTVPLALYRAFEAGELSAVQTWRQISYRFGAMKYGGVETVGWKFTIEDAKVQETL